MELGRPRRQDGERVRKLRDPRGEHVGGEEAVRGGKEHKHKHKHTHNHQTLAHTPPPPFPPVFLFSPLPSPYTRTRTLTKAPPL